MQNNFNFYLNSISEFLNNSRHIGRLAYPALAEDARNLIVKPIFISGILPNPFEELKFREFCTLVEAILAARYAESHSFRVI